MTIALISFLHHKKLLPMFAAVVCCLMLTSTLSAQQQQPQGIAEQDYQLASSHYQQSNWPQSAAAFEDFVNRYPNHRKQTQATFFLAESQMQLGNYTDSLVGFQTFIEQHPNHRLTPRATFRMGEAAFQMGHKQIALKSLELFVKKNPRHELVEYAMPYLGELRLSFGEPKYAQRAFSMALQLYPESELTDQNRFGLAQSFRMLGKINTAVRHWKFVADQRGSDYAGRAQLELGMLEFENKEYALAKPLLAEAVLNLPFEDVEHRLKANYWLARVALEQGNFEQANSIFTGIDTLPADEDCGAGICYDAAVAAWKTEREDLAIEWLAKLRSTWPTNQIAPRAMALEIELLRQRGLDAVALDYCNQFATRFPENELRFNVAEIAGRTLYKQKKYALGVTAFADLLADHSEAFEGDTTAPQQRYNRMTWLYLKGLCHVGLGDFATAVQELRLAQANMLDSDSQPQIELAIGTSLFGQQLYSEATAELESFLEKANSNDRVNVLAALSRLVVCYGELGRWEDADDSISVLIQGDRPSGLDAVAFMADHAWENQRFDLAMRYYKVLMLPENDQQYRSQGLAGLSGLMMEDESAEANNVFHRLVSEYPDSKFAIGAAMSRANFLEEKGMPDLASEFYRKVVERFPSYEMAQIARLRLASFHQKASDMKSLRAAKKLTEEFLDVASKTPVTEAGKSQTLTGEALYQLAWIDHDLGDVEASNEAFAELVATQPKSKYWPDAAWRLAYSLLQQERHQEASEMVTRILAQPNAPDEIKLQTLYLQSTIAAATDRWEDVPRLMDRLIANSDKPKVVAAAKYWKAESLYRYGDFHGAAVIFDELQPTAADLGESLEPWLLLRLAQCHGKSQRWTNAATIANDCLNRFADFSNAYEYRFLLGRSAEYDGMFEDARKRYQEVIESANGSGTETAAIAQWRIGETHFHQNNHKLAIAAYKKTTFDYSFEKWSSAALIQAGKCQEHLENWEQAEKLYTDLLKLHPESEFVFDAKQRLGRVSRLADLPTTETQTR